MRVRLIFLLNNRGACIPFHHQYLLANLVQELKEEMPEDLKEYNLFTFSGVKGQTKVGRDGLHYFSSRITVVISSPEERFINELLKALFKRTVVKIGEMEVVPEGVEREVQPDYQESMKFICIAPLVLAGPNTQEEINTDFINPFDDMFSDYLYESTMIRMEESKLFTDEELQSFNKFQVVPDKEYLTKTIERAKKFSRIYATRYNGMPMDVRGYTLPLTLYAHEKVQRFIFECGFGEFVNSGFGMLDIANMNPIGRSEPYKISE